jgi:hypothetical protein
LRWLRTVRDARPKGYAGLVFTQGLAWALLNTLIASGLSPLSLWLLGLSFFLRLTLAMMVGAEVLGDHSRCYPISGCCLCAISPPSACGPQVSQATRSSGAGNASP